MQLTWMQFIIAALACYRISLLFTRESGPAKIFQRLRRAPKKNSAIADWLSCIFCFSMTGSAFVCLALWLSGVRAHYAEWFLLWCGLSAATIMANQRFTKGEL